MADVDVDDGVKVRCYVEGDTELGAMRAALGSVGGIDFINLRGEFSARGGRGLAFRDSLIADDRSHTFSFIVLDGDSKDTLRVVGSAARDDLFCGRFLVSKPDIEFGNFTTVELCDVVEKYREEQGEPISERTNLLDHLAGARSGKELFQRLRALGAEYSSLAKGASWGACLMEYALSNPMGSDNSLRPLMQLVQMMFRARTSKYQVSRKKYRTDPASGELIDRNAQSG